MFCFWHLEPEDGNSFIFKVAVLFYMMSLGLRLWTFLANRALIWIMFVPDKLKAKSHVTIEVM